MNVRRTSLAAAAGLTIALVGGSAALAQGEYPPGEGDEDTTFPPTAPPADGGGEGDGDGVGEGEGDAEAGGGLADTGADIGLAAGIGAVALALGGGAVLVARRRNQGS